ncbi:NAD(P)-dependent oxidoreductase [Sphaerotilus sp.]|uniref:NAD(P)-dependent oxidoreductase n=1 Tax=Sphaerotilus sp. TaxID=2093942 RepID=UPI00286DA4E7|nr:NAD(P)-dependent oxidoreductase [Sphaerotilus sp.]
MDLLVAEPLEAEVLQWLQTRHDCFYAPRLTEDRKRFAEALAQARAVMLPAQIPVNARVLARAPSLRAIGRIVGGQEHIDLDACARAGVEVLRSPEATAPAEAEFMLGALLTLLRPNPLAPHRIVGRELAHCTVGLVGMGPGARRLGTLLQSLGTQVRGYDPALHATGAQWQRWGVQPVGLRELFEQSDAVCLHLPIYSRYVGLLGDRVLPWCKPGQVLVSMSPIELFDEAVLADLLNSGRMAAAWLDSVGPGTLEPGQPLHGAAGLQTTPRLASYTREARLRSAWGVARQVHDVLRRTPATVRDGARHAAMHPPLLRERISPAGTVASAASPASR